MLSTYQDLVRILVTQQDNITIGDSTDDSIDKAGAIASINEADSVIYARLRGVYQLPLRKRILLNTTGLSVTKSLVEQPEAPKQIQIVINGTGTISGDDNAVVVVGTDTNGVFLSEGLIFKKAGSQVTQNYFATVIENGIQIGTSIISGLTDSSILIINYDILNHISQRLSAFNLYRDIFSNNSPNELPISVTGWKNDALMLLNKIGIKELNLSDQVAPSDVALIDRPVYNIPVKFFEARGVAGIERLEDSDTQAFDSDAPYNQDGGTPIVSTYQQQYIIPPDTWTSSSRPATPYDGQTGLNTETHQFEGWNGEDWVLVG